MFHEIISRFSFEIFRETVYVSSCEICVCVCFFLFCKIFHGILWETVVHVCETNCEIPRGNMCGYVYRCLVCVFVCVCVCVFFFCWHPLWNHLRDVLQHSLWNFWWTWNCSWNPFSKSVVDICCRIFKRNILWRLWKCFWLRVLPMFITECMVIRKCWTWDFFFYVD